jgi:CPA2 family monovalent cation:H+ antiporter-2
VLFAAGTAEGARALLEIGLVLLATGVLAKVAGRFRVSPVPLYLLAGLFIGEGSPIALTASEEFIEVASTIGVVLLLFFLGLEYSPRDLAENLRTSAGAGALDLLNALPGVAAALVLGWSPTAALVMGGVTYISSSGIIAKTLSDLGRLGNRETPTVLSILVIEDLVMALYLPVLAGVLAGGTAGAVGAGLAVALVMVLLVVVASARFGDRLSSLVFSRNDEALLLTILGVTLLIAGLAERVGVSAGVGAFLVGIALSGPAQQRAETLVAPLRDLFAAAFFIFFTFRIDPAELPGAAPVALVLAAVVGTGKVVTGWWAAGRAGVGRAGRFRAGLTLVPAGEFSIVIAGFGVAAGVEDRLGATAATYVLILAIAGPVLARSADPLARRLRLGARPAGPRA